MNKGETDKENRSFYNNYNGLIVKNQPNNLQQLLQGMINVLAQSQESQIDFEEQIFMKILIYAGENQDLVGWLELANSSFEANNIVGAKKLAIANASLMGLAAFW
ncbi:14019_t:CDS:1 [Dentiscutata erythropus]|uniref:14019_t:CDS:1 n=1 Tax=Dentiscutata erythropus TaxID=1348616 RepID=A0A9N9J0N5_9GLOM|nr:14019_t:CDS:1 [Dentiscutata erythropus]